MSRKSRRNIPAKTQPQAPVSERRSILHQQIAMQESWHGPLPPPEQLARFDQVVPGCAERIIKMAELEGVHSREVQMRAVRGNVRLQHIGQACAFILASGAIGGAVYLAMHDHDMVAGILVGGTLATIVLAFLKGKKDS